MRQASKRIPDSAEKTVRDIRRNTRRHHSAEEKIRIVLEGLRGEVSIADSAARKASIRTSITGGPRSFWKPARNGWLATRCQSALEWDPLSAFKRDPFERRVLTVALAPSELVGVAETARVRAV